MRTTISALLASTLGGIIHYGHFQSFGLALGVICFLYLFLDYFRSLAKDTYRPTLTRGNAHSLSHPVHAPNVTHLAKT